MFLFWIRLGSLWYVYCQNCLQENLSLDSFYKVSFSWGCSLFLKIYYTTLHRILLWCLDWCTMAGAPSWCLKMLDTLQKQVCSTTGSSLGAHREPFAYYLNVVRVSLFYRYYLGKCSSKLTVLGPLPYLQVRSARYFDRLHNFISHHP